MPNYEFRCLTCRRRFDIFLKYDEYGKKPVVCPRCGSNDVQRKIGRVRIARSDESRLESLADPAMLDGIDEDPRTLGRMMREMSGQVGEDMGPEFDEVVKRLESGQPPEDIERDMPDLGAADSGGSDMGGDLEDF
jgi:putative FmdB family regulatory protein